VAGFGDPVEGGLSAGDLVENLVGGLCPDKGLGVVVPVEDPAVDPGFEFGDGGEAGMGQGLRLSTETQHSTRLSHDELVG
jgi:hypothetical protein